MRLYTRTGDDGTTGMFGGGRVPKDHPRIEACGNVDELNAAIGLVIAAIDGTGGAAASSKGKDAISSILKQLQPRLFDLGADLATPLGTAHEGKTVRIGRDHITQAEQWIDQIDDGNDPMKAFVMPGGTELAARLHLARTICRRAERSMIPLLNADEPMSPDALKFINRVSDLLFAMARLANKHAGVPDVKWEPHTQSSH